MVGLLWFELMEGWEFGKEKGKGKGKWEKGSRNLVLIWIGLAILQLASFSKRGGNLSVLISRIRGLYTEARNVEASAGLLCRIFVGAAVGVY